MYRKDIVMAVGWRETWVSHLYLFLFVLISLVSGSVLGILGPIAVAITISSSIGILLIILRQDELITVLLLAAHLYVDWYMAYDVLGILLVSILLGIFYLTRDAKHPWAVPRMLWLWMIFLVFALFPAIRGALAQRDVLIYYPNVVLGALLLFCLGTFLAKNVSSLHRFFKGLALLGCLIGIHTFIQAKFNVTLFGLPRVDAYVASMGNYQLSSDASVHRVGSFFIDPNWDGTFLAMLFFVPLGLFAFSDTVLNKLLYASEMICILIGLLFTFSAGASISLVGQLTIEYQ